MILTSTDCTKKERNFNYKNKEEIVLLDEGFVTITEVSRCEFLCSIKRILTMIPPIRTNIIDIPTTDISKLGVVSNGSDKVCCGLLYRRLDLLYQWAAYLEAAAATSSLSLYYSSTSVKPSSVHQKSNLELKSGAHLDIILHTLSTMKVEFAAGIPDLLAYYINGLRLGSATPGSPARVVASLALQKAFGAHALSSALINSCLRVDIEDVGFEYLSIDGLVHNTNGIRGRKALSAPFSDAVFTAAEIIGTERNRDRGTAGYNNSENTNDVFGNDRHEDRISFGLPLPSTWIFSILVQMPRGHFGILVKKLVSTMLKKDVNITCNDVDTSCGEILYHLLECSCDGPGEERWYLQDTDASENAIIDKTTVDIDVGIVPDLGKVDLTVVKSFLSLLLMTMSSSLHKDVYDNSVSQSDDLSTLVYRIFLLCMSYCGEIFLDDDIKSGKNNLGRGFIRQAGRRNTMEGRKRRDKGIQQHMKEEKASLRPAIHDETSLELYRALLDSSCSQSIHPAIHAASLWALVHPSMPRQGRQLIWSELGSCRLLQLFEPQMPVYTSSGSNDGDENDTNCRFGLIAEESRPVASACLDALFGLRSSKDRKWHIVSFALHTIAGYIFHPTLIPLKHDVREESIAGIDRQRSQFLRNLLQRCKSCEGEGTHMEGQWIVRRVLDIARCSIPSLNELTVNLRDTSISLQDILNQFNVN